METYTLDAFTGETQMTPWIKIENGLPPMDERVLAWDGMYVDIFFLRNDRDAIPTWYNQEWIDNDNIKSWTSLPKPPEKHLQ